jgi:hypothetical protein
MIRIALLATVLGACASQARPLVAEVQQGPATGARPNRVLVLQATCGSVEYRCPTDFTHTVDGIVRGGLEFAGYNVVDSESLRLETRQRHEEQTTTHTATENHNTTHYHRDILPIGSRVDTDGKSVTSSETDVTILDGSGFDDLTVDQKREVLARAGSDAIVSVRIVVGGTTGIWQPNQNVEVMVKLGVDDGDAMSWATRCTASSNEFSTVTAALEHAARCAIHGAPIH